MENQGPNVMPTKKCPTPHPHAKTRRRWSEDVDAPSPALSFADDDDVPLHHNAHSEEDGWFEMLECLGVSAERIEVIRAQLNQRPMSIAGCINLLQSYEGGRLKLLSQLKAAGLNLPESQRVTNAFCRGLRAVDKSDEANLQASTEHMILLQAAGFDRPSEAAATAAWGEELDSVDYETYEDAEEYAEEAYEEYSTYAEPGSTPRGPRLW